MALRIGPGPVFWVELVAAGRRWQTYALRTGLVFALFLTLGFVWTFDHRYARPGGISSLTLNEYAAIGTEFATTILFAQLAFVLLAAPAATAGAICLDRAHGKLDLLLTTDLSAVEIVFGKLLARLLPVAGLIGASLPVLFITTLLGGVSGELLLNGLVVVAGAAVLGSALALFCSLYVGRMYEALLLTYLIETVWIFGDSLVWILAYASPALATRIPMEWFVGPYQLLLAPTYSLGTANPFWLALFLAQTLGVAALLVLFAAARLRRVVLRRPTRKGSVSTRRRSARLLTCDPLLWYEYHRKRPTRVTRIIWMLYALAALASTGWAIYRLETTWLWRAVGSAMPIAQIQIGLGLLLVTVFAVAAFIDESERSQRDVILATPLSTRAIILAKWRAASSVLPKLLIIPTVLAICISNSILNDRYFGRFQTRQPEHLGKVIGFTILILHPLACGAMLTSLGLFLVTWLGKFGRAVCMAVGAYLAILTSSYIIIFFSDNNRSNSHIVHWAANPLWVSDHMIDRMHWSYNSLGLEVYASIAWAIAYVIAAVVLFFMTICSYDLRVRRVPESGMKRREVPPWERGIIPPS